MGRIINVIVAVCAAASIFTLSSCNNTSGVLKIVAERDSLRLLADSTQRQLLVMNTMIFTINSSLDSIAEQEGMIFVQGSSETPVNRKDAMHNLDRFQQLVTKQRERIAQLESMLDENKSNTDLLNLVEHMKEQLAMKDLQIAELRKELSNKNADISQLHRKLARQGEAIEELNKRNQVQTAALSRQDEILNHCYVLIGTKDDLKRKGVLKKKKLQSDAFDKSKFAKVDIRTFHEISFEAKKARILTNMPTSSYVLSTNGKRQFVLKITNPTNFWSISNFLVIQTD